MAFWKRSSRQPEARRAGRATVLDVGSSITQSQQQSISVRLRLAVDLYDGDRYQVTTAWRIEHPLIPKVQEGATFKVDVTEGSPEQVHPRDGRMIWDRMRTPEDTKLRPVDDG